MINFQFLGGLNDCINLPHMNGSFLSCANTSMVAKNGTKFSLLNQRYNPHQWAYVGAEVSE